MKTPANSDVDESPETPTSVASSAGLDITPGQVVDKINCLGLRSCAIHGASETEAKLSQPRGVLVMLRRMFKESGDDEIVALCDSGITTLTNMIGDGFKHDV